MAEEKKDCRNCGTGAEDCRALTLNNGDCAAWRDPVNHPPHYTKGGIEVLAFIEAWGMDFRAGNVIKYVVRAPHKGKRLEDLQKARFYLDRLIAEASK
jgi:hypothetical protein